MRVFVIAGGYPTEENPMNGIFEFDQAKALKDRGIDVVFLALDLRSIRRKRKFGYYNIEKNNINICSLNLPIGKIPTSIFSVISKVGLRYLYNKAVKAFGEPDIIHAHFCGSMIFGVNIFKKKFNKPLIITEHSSIINQDIIPHNVLLYSQKYYNQADKLIAVSQSLSRKIKRDFNKDCIVVNNIVDTTLFNYTDSIIKDTEFKIISVGSLIYGKGFDVLIKAFAKALKVNNNMSLIIIGEGQERGNIEKLIESYNLQQKVTLLGRKQRNIISEYFNQSNCFVLASRSETFGVVYIEALANGLPVIATRCGGPEEFINETNGILVDVNDIDKLSEAIIRMETNIANYNPNNISKECNSKFSPDNIANKILTVYRDAL